MVCAININGWSVGCQGVCLGRGFEIGDEYSIGDGQAYKVCVGFGRWKGQEEVRVDGELRFLLAEEFESRLADGLPGASWWRQVQPEAGCGEFDFDNVGSEVSGRSVAEGSRGDAGVGVCGNRLGACHPGAQQHDQGQRDRPARTGYTEIGQGCAGTQCARIRRYKRN